jgi:Secretion system C-terminal sorting domain
MAAMKSFVIQPKLMLLKMTRCVILFTASVSFSHFSSAQTTISGVVNTYYKVIEIIPAKACVRLNTVTGLNFNDKTMLIQMKGAGINTSSSTSGSFGDTTSLNNAGNYEIGTICYIKNDSVFFDYLFLKNYTIAGQVQLIKVPEYYSATVVDTLKAAPWNNTTGTGGIVAIFVDENLVLNAPVSADSAGYRGGAFRLSNGTCSNTPGATAYAYNPTSATQNGAYKGEGVADVAIAQAGGRGAPANGGGGGNNHNNGGAGGANLNAGGDGGGNSSSAGCTTAIQGKGGKALSSYGGTKIFMGGGGGAGHANNGYISSNGGGHGGGILFIRANNLTGNNYSISANGQMGGPASSDGASGAGAGGTIILDVNNYIGTTNVAANGGQGGTENDGGNINRCYGSGGGGSGGVMYFTGAIPSAPVTETVSGGNAGPELGRDASCNAAVSSSPGSAGQIISNYTYSISLVLANNYCTFLLPVELSWFNAQYINGQTILNWKTPQPELIDLFRIERSSSGNNWTAVHDLPANDDNLIYHAIDPSPLTGYNYYRIKINKKSNAVVYSSIQKVFVPAKNKEITVYPNPAGKTIFITGITSSPELGLFDLSGKLLWQKRIVTNQNSIEVDLPFLPSGVYMMRIDTVMKKIVVH